MTRDELLTYLTTTYAAWLTAAQLAPVDEPTALAYVLNDAMLYHEEAQQVAVATRELRNLVTDRCHALGVTVPNFEESE